MRKARINLKCFLLAGVITLHTFGGVAAKPAVQEKKAAKHRRSVSQLSLKSIDPLKEAFERNSGNVRLVMILSPT